MPFADETLREFIDALASGGPDTPGAGAAAAVTLALAAACASKAIGISLKHQPDQPRLTRAREQLDEIISRALRGADEDARRFAEALHAKDPQAGKKLERAEAGMQQLADSLAQVLKEIEPEISPVMKGDMVAAAALCKAAHTIEAENLAESRADPASG